MNKKINIFHTSLVGGLIFILVAIFLIHNEGSKWYLIGMGQIMIAVGLVGVVVNRKKEVKDSE